MAPRPSWKGYLKLSLVSCPVALYPASSASEKVSFHMLNGETGNRLKQQYVDSDTGDVVERDERVKGYEVAKGDYVVVSDDELADVQDRVEPHDRHRELRAAATRSTRSTSTTIITSRPTTRSARRRSP